MAMYALVIERFYFLFSLLVQHFGSASLWHETIHYQLNIDRECISAKHPWQGLPRGAGRVVIV